MLTTAAARLHRNSNRRLPTASCTSLIRRLRTLTPPNNRSRYSLSKNGAGVKLVSRSEPTSAAIARWF